MKSNNIFEPFKCSVQLLIDENHIEYVLEIDVTGHVYSAKAMIFELPEAAMKLSINEGNEELERKIRAYSGLFEYIVPLVLSGRLPSYTVRFESIVQEVNSRLASVSLNWGELYDKVTEGSIAQLAFIGLGNFSEPRSKMRQIWDKISTIIEKMRDGKVHGDLKFLAEAHISDLGFFFVNIAPFFPSVDQKYVLKHLSNFKSEKLKQYLIGELKKPDCHHYVSGLIYGFLSYEGNDIDIYNAIITYFDNTKEISEETLEAMCEVLLKHNTDKSIQVGYELLNRNEEYSAPKAARLLYEHLENKQDLFNRILLSLEHEEIKKSGAAYQILSEPEYTKYLPEAKDILMLMVRTMEKGRDQSVIYSMAPLVRNTGIIHLQDEVYELLSHDFISVREGILLLIICCGHEIGAPEYSSHKFMEKYYSLALDEDLEVRRCAFRILEKGGKYIMNPDNVDKLLGILNELPKDKSAMDAMTTINYILDSIPYQPQIEDYYKKALEEKDGHFRKYAMIGLTHSSDVKLKKSLFAYENDSSEEVRKLVEQIRISLPIE